MQSQGLQRPRPGSDNEGEAKEDSASTTTTTSAASTCATSFIMESSDGGASPGAMPSSQDAGPIVVERYKAPSPGPLPLRVLATIWFLVTAMFFLAVVFVTNCLIQLVMVPVCYFWPKYQSAFERVTARVMNCSARSLVGVNCLWWRVKEVNRPPPGLEPQRALVMSNHISNADGFILRGRLFPWCTKVVYKADLRLVPFLGLGLMSTRDVPVFFTKEKGGWGTKKGTVAQMMKRCLELMNLNTPVLIFPEGTRRMFNRTSPFRDGFFRFALDHNVPIYPVAIHGTDKAWPLGSAMLGVANIYVAYGQRYISPEGKDIEQLKDAVRDEMVELLKLCPSYDAEKERPIKTVEEFKRLEILQQKKIGFL